MGENELSESAVIAFADKYLYPYNIKEKYNGTEIVPETCPYCHGGEHGDKNTFALSLTLGCFVCKRGSCGVNGRIEELMRHVGADPSTIRYGGRKVVERAAKYKLPNVELYPVTEEIFKYFESRKISRETVKAYKIAADKNGNIIFPFYDGGVLTYVKYRKPRTAETKTKEWQEPSAKPIIFGMDACVFDKPLYITEGEIDAMSLAEAGIVNAVSVPCGCDNLLWIENCYDWLEKFNTIVLFGDSDTPGIRMVNEVAKRLDESRCLVVREYPSGLFGEKLKDANDILVELGPIEVVDTANSAEGFEIRGMLDVADIAPYDPTTLNRIQFGIPDLDEYIGGIEEGCITIVTGRSGDGKSTLCNQIVLNSVQQNQKVAIYSGELKAQKLLYWLCLQAAGSEYIGLQYDKVRGKKVPCIDWQVQRRVTDWLSGNVFLFDNEQTRPQGEKEIDTVLRMFTSVARRHAPFVYIVDNVMSLCADQAEELAAQRSMITKLKAFAQKHRCHIFLVAHPRKQSFGGDATLAKDSISGSSSMVNFCDTLIAVERPNIRILKNRDSGVSHLTECCFATDCRRFFQADKGDVFKSYSWDKKDCPRPDVLANTMYGITMAEIQPF